MGLGVDVCWSLTEQGRVLARQWMAAHPGSYGELEETTRWSGSEMERQKRQRGRAAVVKANGYGCGLEPVVQVLGSMYRPAEQGRWFDAICYGCDEMRTLRSTTGLCALCSTKPIPDLTKALRPGVAAVAT